MSGFALSMNAAMPDVSGTRRLARTREMLRRPRRAEGRTLSSHPFGSCLFTHQRGTVLVVLLLHLVWQWAVRFRGQARRLFGAASERSVAPQYFHHLIEAGARGTT